MFANEIYSLSYQALILILILSGPPIIISTVLGLIVAIFQAATQIQEQTLSFTVKLFAVVFTIFNARRLARRNCFAIHQYDL